MTVHIMKMAVGQTDIDVFANRLVRVAIGREGRSVVAVSTRMTPKRLAEIKQGGSLFWVMKGQIIGRCPIIDAEERDDDDGRTRCWFYIDPQLIPVRADRMRPFQGWRYLEPAKAPPDRPRTRGANDLPKHLARDLRALCLI